MYPLRYILDEQRRSLPKFARPKGSSQMTDFCVIPTQGSIKLPFGCRVLKSSIFELLKLIYVRIMHPSFPPAWRQFLLNKVF